MFLSVFFETTSFGIAVLGRQIENAGSVITSMGVKGKLGLDCQALNRVCTGIYG